MSNEPHPCSIPPNLQDHCMRCGTLYIRRDHGPMARGYCGDSCEYEARHPAPIDPADRPVPLTRRD